MQWLAWNVEHACTDVSMRDLLWPILSKGLKPFTLRFASEKPFALRANCSLVCHSFIFPALYALCHGVVLWPRVMALLCHMLSHSETDSESWSCPLSRSPGPGLLLLLGQTGSFHFVHVPNRFSMNVPDFVPDVPDVQVPKFPTCPVQNACS